MILILSDTYLCRIAISGAVSLMSVNLCSIIFLANYALQKKKKKVCFIFCKRLT